MGLLQFVIVVFPDHTHYFSLCQRAKSDRTITYLYKIGVLHVSLKRDMSVTRSVTINTFRKNLFKPFVKIELSSVFTINVFSTAENCMEK